MATLDPATPDLAKAGLGAGAHARRSTPWLYFVTAIAALGGFLFGYDTGVIGGTQLYFTDYFDLSPARQGWVNGSALIGCIIGAALATVMTKALSRKWTLVISAVLFTVSAWGSGAAATADILVVYRIIGGLAIGIASLAAPMLIAEMAPAEERGKMVSINQVGIVAGFFVVFLATYFIGGGNTAGISEAELAARNAYNTESGWRTMFYSELLPAGAFLLLLFFIPHSPRWLAIKGRDADALAVLKKLGASDESAALELRDIRASLDDDRNKVVGFAALAGLGTLVFIGIMLSVFQQVTGINAILYYGAEIFSNALGYGPEDALKQQLWLGAVNFAFTFLALFTVDKWGRKPLLLLGTTGMFIGLMILGVTVYTQQLGVLSLFGILLFIASFAVSMGPVVWVLISEIFPNRARSIAMGIAVAAQWGMNYVVTQTYPIVNRSDVNAEQFSGALPYFIFAGFCVLTFLFVLKFIPETKGRSLEELEAGIYS